MAVNRRQYTVNLSVSKEPEIDLDIYLEFLWYLSRRNLRQPLKTI